jgi:hypothetical protein
MTRPTDPSRYVQGPLCNKCGTTTCYPTGICVECTKRRNAAKYERRREKPEKAVKTEHGKAGRPEKIIITDWAGRSSAPMTTANKISTALAGYSRSPGALERSKRLDAIVRSRSAHLDALILGKKSDEDETPKCAGDVWRSMLSVGFQRPTVTYRDSDMERALELAPLVEAVEAIYAALPDLVTAKDVAGRLDPALVERVKGRWLLAIAARLKKLGAVQVDAGNVTDKTRVTLYITHHPERYDGMKGRKLYAAYAAVKGEQRVQRPRAVSRRALNPKIQGDTAAGRATHGRPSKGQSDQTENKIACFGASHG